MNRTRARLALSVLIVLSACARTTHDPRRNVTNTALANGVVARVGDVDISSVLVGAVAGARGMSPRDAVELLIDDALAAHGARAQRLDADPIIARDLLAVRARVTLEHLRDEARVTPPRDDELADFNAMRWREVDLDEQAHVVHAAVLRKTGTTGPDPEAIAIARQIEAAVASATTAADFETRAKAVPHASYDVRVEELPPFVKDGRTSVGPQEMLAAPFASAALALQHAGDTSPVTESSFGWHVIRLIERLPGKRIAPEDRAAYFAEDIYAARGRLALGRILTAARDRTKPEITPAAEPLMAGLSAATP